MRVAVGVPSGEVGRYNVFWDSLIHVKGVTSDNVICGRGANIAQNRNGIAERAITWGFDAIWYVDDDQVFAPDTLAKLLAHDKDIVSGLYLQREVPWIPHLYRHNRDDGLWYPRLLNHGDSGLLKIDSCGAGCLLLKTKVLKAMEKPWWRLGQCDKVNWSDDHDFLARAREKGFKVYVDLDCPVGHQMNATIWPLRRPDGSWQSALVQRHEAIAIWPAAVDEEAKEKENKEKQEQKGQQPCKPGYLK